MKKIVVTGPESTGKTALAETLALQLDGHLIPEYARSYVEQLKRPYNYLDVEHIARRQARQEREASAGGTKGVLVMDTWLIITKVWFDVVYGRVPGWLDGYIASTRIDLFLVCQPDLPWIADPVRENGGEMRLKLLDLYCREIESYGFAYERVEGVGDIRLQNALKQLEAHHLL